jgi:general stress protein 26
MQNANGNGNGNGDGAKNVNAQPRQVTGSLKELYDLLKEFNVAMLVTRTSDGFLRARPMEIQPPEELPDCDLWFVSGDDTAKVHEIEREQQVAISCYRPGDRAYVSISAIARIDHNQAQLRQLWKPDWSTWLPNGPEDPHAVLIKLTVERAEYWEPAGGKLRLLYEQAKAVAQGKSASENVPPLKRI